MELLSIAALLLGLLAGHRDLVGIDDDDEVARVEVGRVVGLVLAAQQDRRLAREPAEHDVGGVDDVPLARDVGGLGLVRAHGGSSSLWGCGPRARQVRRGAAAVDDT